MAADEAAERLYGLRPEEFTRARNEAAAELRRAGRRAEADEVKALRKPNAAAAAANRLVREHGGEVASFLQAAAALRDAQFGGQGDLAQATRREREALDRLVRLADGDVRQTLEAAAVDDDAAGELRAARLVRELEPRGFGTLLAHGVVPRSAPAKPKAPKRPDDRAARERLREAKEELAAARAEERQARRRHEESRKQLERAEQAVAAAERELDRLRG